MQAIKDTINKKSTKSTVNITKSVDKSTKSTQVEYEVYRLRDILGDQTLGERFVKRAIKMLGHAEVNNIAEYAVDKGHHPGKLFVAIAHKAMGAKS